MAIISIPSSIGGITIPGLTNVPGGPLGVLFGNPNQITKLQYPRDLGSPTRGHYILFSINEITPVNYSVSGIENKLKSFNQAYSEGGASGLFALGKETIGVAAKSIGNFAKETVEGSIKESFDILLEKRKSKKVSSIALYMPDTVNFQMDPQYGQSISLASGPMLASVGAAIGSKLPGKAGKAAASMLSDANARALSPAIKLGLATQGLAFNPQEQILFDGIDFRTYQLAFTFTPYSRQEAKTVKDIIKEFRKYAAPQIKEGAAGMFFIPPATFDLQFKFNGKDNENITKVGESVITSIDVNYAPNGFSAHSDGAPVQTTLTLQFKELQLVDRTKISDGF
jgi:hypothetical protein